MAKWLIDAEFRKRCVTELDVMASNLIICFVVRTFCGSKNSTKKGYLLQLKNGQIRIFCDN